MNIFSAFRYCPRCGHQFKKETTYLKCESCGLNYYLNPKPCTAIILYNDQKELLFVERAVEPKKGWLDLPGGFVEINETFEEGARREVKEELGIELADMKYIGSFYDQYDYQDVTYPTLAVNYIAQLPSKAPLNPADDVTGYKFFALENVPLDKLAFPSMLGALDILRKITLQNG